MVSEAGSKKHSLCDPGSGDRFRNIDNLKGLAILGVVWAHLAIGGAGLRVTQALFGWCVIAFFWAAGALQVARRTKRGLGEWLGHRARRLLLPALAFLLLNNTIMLCLVRAGIITTISRETSVLAFLTSNFAPQLYYLWYLFVIEAFVGLFPRVRSILVVAALVLFGVLLHAYSPTPSPYGSYVSNLPFYLAAYLLPHAWALSIKRKRIEGALAIVLVAAAGMAAGITWFGILILVPPILAAALPKKAIPVLSALGVYSGIIFIWHAPVVSNAIQRFVPFPLRENYGCAWAVVIIIVVASVLVGTAVNRARWLKLWHF